MPEIHIACKAAELVPRKRLKIIQGDLKSLSTQNYTKLRNEIAEKGFSFAIHVWDDGKSLCVLDGTQRLRTVDQMCEKEGFTCPLVPVVYVEATGLKQAVLKLLGGAGMYGKPEQEGLYALMHQVGIQPVEIGNVELPGIRIDKFVASHFDGAEPVQGGALARKFGVPPFSVLDARTGYWQEKKDAWLAKGIESEVGRCDDLLGAKSDRSAYGKASAGTKADGTLAYSEGVGTTSIFDPVLCELVYRWFSPKGGLVLDPFAGGSVRGVVAGLLERHYFGIELRPEQVEANRVQAEKICQGEYMPAWKEGDSAKVLPSLESVEADLVFSCPPYLDLEVYSELPGDLSNMPDDDDFYRFYSFIMKEAVARLRQDRFAVMVVSEVREKKRPGFYRGFVQMTIHAMETAGARFYNEAILVTPVGSLQLRAGKPFVASRKLGRTHQNVLVFCKGDPFEAAKACGVVDVSAEEEA